MKVLVQVFKFTATLITRIGLLTMLIVSARVEAETLRVAVASNFLHTLELLAGEYKKQKNASLRISAASSGKHFAQITQGAPFDVFLSADSARPVELENRGLIAPGSRFTYALGTLAFYYPAAKSGTDPLTWIERDDIQTISFANPRTAPYGLAAQEAMQSLGWWNVRRQVRGENVSQALHFIVSGNAQMGVVSLAQLNALETVNKAGVWLPEQQHYSPVEQQAVQLSNKPEAAAFLAFLRSPEARHLIREQGYGVAQ